MQFPQFSSCSGPMNGIWLWPAPAPAPAPARRLSSKVSDFNQFLITEHSAATTSSTLHRPRHCQLHTSITGVPDYRTHSTGVSDYRTLGRHDKLRSTPTPTQPTPYHHHRRASHSTVKLGSLQDSRKYLFYEVKNIRKIFLNVICQEEERSCLLFA